MSHPTWGDATGDLYLNEGVFLSHVPEEIWKYELGGYPVLKKWLGYRQEDCRGGVPSSLQELDYFRGMIMRIAAVLILHSRLDECYERASQDAFSGASWLLTGNNEIVSATCRPENLSVGASHEKRSQSVSTLYWSARGRARLVRRFHLRSSNLP